MLKIFLSSSFLGFFLFGCLNSTDIPKNYADDIRWREQVEKLVNSTDDAGHGPDVDTDEWCGIVEFKLFQRNSMLKPCSIEWSKKVNEVLSL